MIGYSPTSTVSFLLPAGLAPSFTCNLIVWIRDEFECVTEFQSPLVYVRPDVELINRSGHKSTDRSAQYSKSQYNLTSDECHRPSDQPDECPKHRSCLDMI
jgi:hypothetical protein